jgi:hypothetical protein
MTDRPGLKFQDFVAKLERALHEADGVRIHSPLRLRDKDTGRLREHDVVISRATHHGCLLTSIECRDRRRKVTVPDVEAFAKKCERTGVHHGVIVASRGFAETARAKASALNISCVDASEVESFSWIGNNVLVGRVVNYIDMGGSLVLDDAGRQPREPYNLIDKNGYEIGSKAFADLIDLEQEMDADTPPDVHQKGVLSIEDGRFRVLDADGRVFAVRRLTLHYTFVIKETRTPFQLHRYHSAAGHIEIASSHAGGEDTKAELMLISSPAGLKGVLTHHPHANPRVKVGDLPSRPLRPPLLPINPPKLSGAE